MYNILWCALLSKQKISISKTVSLTQVPGTQIYSYVARSGMKMDLQSIVFPWNAIHFEHVQPQCLPFLPASIIINKLWRKKTYANKYEKNLIEMFVKLKSTLNII